MFVSIASFLQKIDALRWTPHLDECLQVLDDKQECLNDEILVQQVRLQLIAEKVTLSTWYDGAMETAEHVKAPPSFYFQALHSQLQEVKNKFPPQSQRNGKLSLTNDSVLSNNFVEVVLAHLYSTELTINEMALSQVPITTHHSNFQQMESLFACVKSIKSWFEVFFTIPTTAYIGFPFSIFSQLVRCLVTLWRLSTLNDPAWDKNGVQKAVDLLLTMDHVINNMEQATTLAGLDNSNIAEGDVFSRTAKLFRSIRHGWEAKLGPEEPIVSTIPTPPTANETSLPEPFPVDFADSDWVMDFLLTQDH